MAKAIRLYEVLRRPLITEKNTVLQAQNKYGFEVALKANKLQVKTAVEKAFKVEVIKVNVMNVPGKTRSRGRFRVRTIPWKKAIGTLKAGDKIELFEGV